VSAPTGWRASRGSSSIGASGLFVLGLGCLVLLTGLGAPNPQPQSADPALPAGVMNASSPRASQHWMAGVGMIAVSLLGLGARQRTRTLPWAQLAG
jgi:hypothetical protein